MAYAPATYEAPPRARLADTGRPRPRRHYARRLWAWWSTPYSAAHVRRSGYALLIVGTATLAFVAGVVWGVTAGEELITIQQAVAR